MPEANTEAMIGLQSWDAGWLELLHISEAVKDEESFQHRLTSPLACQVFHSWVCLPFLHLSLLSHNQYCEEGANRVSVFKIALDIHTGV
jgi:hypothetical protein